MRNCARRLLPLPQRTVTGMDDNRGGIRYDAGALVDALAAACGRSGVEVPGDEQLEAIALDMMGQGVRALPVPYGTMIWVCEPVRRKMWNRDKARKIRTYYRVHERLFTIDRAQRYASGWMRTVFPDKESAAAAAKILSERGDCE